MDAYLPCLYAALAALRDHIEPKVALFSTTVVTVLLADVVRGRKDTTGGTSIDCVVADLLSARPRKALLMTDGHVGEIDRRDRTRLESAGVEVRVLLTPGGWREHLAPVASRFDELPPLDAGTWRVTSRASGALPCRGGSA
jgi:hypothetical protein